MITKIIRNFWYFVKGNKIKTEIYSKQKIMALSAVGTYRKSILFQICSFGN